MNIKSTEDFRRKMKTVYIRNDVEMWDLAVSIKNFYMLRTIFEAQDLPDEALAPFIARHILESNLDE